jgi:hypothetical protein
MIRNKWWAFVLGLVWVLTIQVWTPIGPVGHAQEKTAQPRLSHRSSNLSAEFLKLLEIERRPRQQVQMSDLEDVVCVFDQTGEKLWGSFEVNTYGTLLEGISSPILASKARWLYCPTDRNDHLATPYLDMIPCRAGKIRCLALFLKQSADAHPNKLTIFLQRDGCVALATMTTVDDRGKPVQVFGPVVVPQDVRKLRIVIQASGQVPTLLPDAIKVKAGYLDQPVAVKGANWNTRLAVWSVLCVGLFTLAFVAYWWTHARRLAPRLRNSWWALRPLWPLLSEVVCSRWGPRAPGPLLATFALWLAVVGTGIAINRQCLAPFDQPIINDRHAMISLEMVINQQRFGCLSHLYVGHLFVERDKHIFTLLPENPAMLSQRLRDLPEKCNDSATYYAQNLVPVVNNENSLMLIDRAVLWLVPDITLAGMILAHTVIKVLCLAVFVFFLLRAGFSPILSLAVFHIALLIVQDVNHYRPLSIYPFLLPCTLFLVAILGLTLNYGLHRCLWKHVPAMVLFGISGAFLTNLRTSYFPVVAALVLFYTLIASLDLRGTLRLSYMKTGLSAALTLACIFAGFRTFTATFISPLEKACTVNCGGLSYSYHVIAHPLVLFLAVPPNELASREGIAYDDAYGLKLARRIDPKVRFLGPNYDKALFVYYFKLWLYYPLEMIHLYQAKFQLAAFSASQARPVSDTKWATWFRVLGFPLQCCANFLIYVILFGALSVIPVCLARWLNPARAFALSALAAGGLLLFLELALLTSECCLIYNSFLCFWLLFVGMLCYQGIADGSRYCLRWGIQAMKRRWQGEGSASTLIPT